MSTRFRSFYSLFLICGMALGILIGHWALPNIHEVLSEPLDDILFAIGGAFVGGLAHELLAGFSGER